MHTAGKVLLIVGVITALGIVLIVGGAATANLDPSNENTMREMAGILGLSGMISTQFTLRVQSIVNRLK